MSTYEIVLTVLCALVALAIVKVAWIQRRFLFKRRS